MTKSSPGEQRGDEQQWTADRMPTMSEMLDMEVQGWRPIAGEKLVGTVVRVSTAGSGSGYGEYPLVTVLRSDGGGLVNVHAFHTTLRNEIMREGAGRGDSIAIKYLGVVEGGSFGKYESYRVIVEHANGNDGTATYGQE